MFKQSQKFSTWFNLRSLVILLALYLLLAPSKPALFESLDRLIFSIGASLMNPPDPTSTVAVITLPPQEAMHLRDDMGQAQATENLLKQLLTKPNLQVGLVYIQPPASLLQNPNLQNTNQQQSLLNQVAQQSGIDADLKEQIAIYSRTQASLTKLLNDQKLAQAVVTDVNGNGQWTSSAPPYPNLAVQENSSSDIVNVMPPWLRPSLYRLPAPLVDSEIFSQSPILFPLISHQSIEKSLLFQTDHGVHAEYLLRLYAQREPGESITWQKNRGVQLGAVHLPLSANGSFVPYYHDAEHIKTYRLGVALSSLPTENWVLIGPEQSTALMQAATDLLSLDNQHYFYSAAWMSWAPFILTLLMLAYLILLLPKMSPASAIFATCLLLLIFGVAQLGWQITQWQYLPLGGVIQFLIFGHVLMLLWTMQRDNWRKLQAAAHGARYQLGLQLFRDGRADDALLAVKECYSSDAVLTLMYDIASQQERKRQYGEAVKTYQAIMHRQQNFRDAREKVEKLIAFSSTGTGSFGADTTIAKTLIISESSINKPVLGRYEIERELGRGAMGIVYLGRDPKISRQVAIKTLSYNNMPDSELDEFKERFFREAEAAGRLNHPNIVTIYDVGEEHDLAFIAMDFVEGESLSAHSSEEHLLPVEKVYQITIDVAEALQYAHEKNVVHRDIKPSNIMYESVGGKVKVTDFGVARIVDSNRTQTGDILGSPLYMSPEQLKAAKVTNQSDIYSLGVTFYQLLTGKLPHSGDSLANLTYAIIHEKHIGVRELRPDLPKSLTRIINKAIHKEPNKRYAQAKDFAAAVRKALEEDFVV